MSLKSPFSSKSNFRHSSIIAHVHAPTSGDARDRLSNGLHGQHAILGCDRLKDGEKGREGNERSENMNVLPICRLFTREFDLYFQFWLSEKIHIEISHTVLITSFHAIIPKVLRPMNAFMLWAKDHRKKLIANGFDGATVSKMLADEWKTLSDQHKQVSAVLSTSKVKRTSDTLAKFHNIFISLVGLLRGGGETQEPAPDAASGLQIQVGKET